MPKLIEEKTMFRLRQDQNGFWRLSLRLITRRKFGRKIQTYRSRWTREKFVLPALREPMIAMGWVEAA